MTPTIIYLLKVNIAIALFFMFYRLFFAGDTFWKTRRIYLLFSSITSFLYPFLSIEGWLQRQQPVRDLVINYAQLQEFIVTPVTSTDYFEIESILWIAYLLIVVALTVRMLMQLISIVTMRLKGRIQNIEGIDVISIEKDITPFSFFGDIYMNPKLHNENEIRQILTHELTHVQQFHSVDVILSELLCIVFWFNPATWLLKREVRQNLEFLADNKVISSGFDSKSYQYHLLQLSYQSPDFYLTNKFNILPLKKRIMMMNQKKSRKSTALKYLLIAPLTFTLVVLSNAETLANSAKEMLSDNAKTTVSSIQNVKAETNQIAQLTVTDTAKVENTKKIVTPQPPLPPPPSVVGDEVIFTVVETMPSYPGGDQALFKFLSENVRYPVKAQESGIQGRVICQFVINRDGSVDSVKTVRSVDPLLDAEAIRVIRLMPNWTPGTQKGKAVRVRYTLPVNFRLQGDKNSKTDVKPTFDPKNPPLIVLDGEVLPSNFNMTLLKPEKIEKIEVLKDDAATKVYGEKGKNGVILITSKK